MTFVLNCIFYTLCFIMFWSEQVQQLSIKLHASNLRNDSLQSYLDDSLYKLAVFFLVSDGVVRLADVLQSETFLLLLNFLSSQSLLDRRAVLLASCDVLSPFGSRGAVLLLHVVNGGPQTIVNNGILIPDGVSTIDNIVGDW